MYLEVRGYQRLHYPAQATRQLFLPQALPSPRDAKTLCYISAMATVNRNGKRKPPHTVGVRVAQECQ